MKVSLRVLWDKYFSDAHAVIYVVDSSDFKRLEEAKKEIGNTNTLERGVAPCMYTKCFLFRKIVS